MELSNYENTSGFAHTIMMDCQRVLACLAVEDEDEKSRIGVSYFVIVARCSGFSKRLLLAMNSQAEWRTDCAQVEIRKVCPCFCMVCALAVFFKSSSGLVTRAARLSSSVGRSLLDGKNGAQLVGKSSG